MPQNSAWRQSSANRGKAFEQMIEAACRQYLIDGQAQIVKTEVQNKFIAGRMVYSQKGPPDFIGTIKGGQAVAFDAKNTQAASFPISKITDRPHQLEHLKNVHALGGIAFYLINMERENRVFIIPLPQIINAIERAQAGGRKSIPITEMPIEVKGTWKVCLDFLAPYLK